MKPTKSSSYLITDTKLSSIDEEDNEFKSPKINKNSSKSGLFNNLLKAMRIGPKSKESKQQLVKDAFESQMD